MLIREELLLIPGTGPLQILCNVLLREGLELETHSSLAHTDWRCSCKIEWIVFSEYFPGNEPLSLSVNLVPENHVCCIDLYPIIQSITSCLDLHASSTSAN